MADFVVVAVVVVVEQLELRLSRKDLQQKSLRPQTSRLLLGVSAAVVVIVRLSMTFLQL